MAYFSGQGRLLIAVRDGNGNPGVFRAVGNVPELKVSLSTETIDHHESQFGQRLQDLRLVKSKKVETSFTLEDFTIANLAFAMYGTAGNVTGAVVAAEIMPSGIVVNDEYRVKQAKLSAVTVTDSTGSPKTLTLGVNYTIDLNYGTIKFIDITTGGAYVQPFKVAYTHATITGNNLTMFGAAPSEYWLRFEGLNTANSNSPVLVELYRTVMDPIKEFSVIHDDLMKMEMSGSNLYDSIRTYDAQLGYFGRVVNLA